MPHLDEIFGESIEVDGSEFPVDTLLVEDPGDGAEHLTGFTAKSSKAPDCGANAPGGGGFQPGNTCANEGGEGTQESAGDDNRKSLNEEAGLLIIESAIHPSKYDRVLKMMEDHDLDATEAMIAGADRWMSDRGVTIDEVKNHYAELVLDKQATPENGKQRRLLQEVILASSGGNEVEAWKTNVALLARHVLKNPDRYEHRVLADYYERMADTGYEEFQRLRQQLESQLNKRMDSYTKAAESLSNEKLIEKVWEEHDNKAALSVLVPEMHKRMKEVQPTKVTNSKPREWMDDFEQTAAANLPAWKSYLEGTITTPIVTKTSQGMPGVSHEQNWDSIRSEMKSFVVERIGVRLESREGGPRQEDYERLLNDLRNNGARVNKMQETTERSVVAAVVDNWAASSGDSNAAAAAMQIAVDKEFGLQKGDDIGGMETHTYSHGLEIYRKHETAMRAVVQAIYSQTQEDLQKAQITHLPLYRGIGLGRGAIGTRGKQYDEAAFHLAGVKANKANEEVTGSWIVDESIESNPLSSYSLDPLMAAAFAGSTDDKAMMMTKVPREHVFCTFASGMGCMSESEVVVIGHSRSGKMLVDRESQSSAESAYRRMDQMPDLIRNSK